MFVNVLRFRFKAGVSADEQAEVLAAMRRTAAMDSTAFGVVGADLGDPADGFTHAYLAAIPDLESFKRYTWDPVHLAGDDVILDKLEKMSAVRFSDDDPEVGRAMYAEVARKSAEYPEWSRRVDELFA
ncbi:Dabb family protein [Kribbella speibonae]|uniref:Dabb family protein n=1 Tax=Kribbella speibonae TaxID=1572660 RepID=A0A4R0JIU2_9ACTN|nr:Dabb family protein [Kribbella speibonae]TCC20418.1 Dabb family protein [Kribbella speibonae]TCC41695.1 Dabb family protein [Kribbella speibonae]